VTAAWRALGPSRAVLVTDAVAASGAPAGSSTLGGCPVEADGTCVRTSSGALAGSLLTMDAAVRNVVTWTGCSAAEAVQAASRTPADLLGAEGRGRIEPGACGDLVLLDPELRVAATVLRGQVVHGELPWRS
jgi:N-acetylglucosamine-6-phosphate deacetylase